MTVPGDCSGRVSAIRVARLAQTNAIFRRPTVPDGRGVKFILSLLSRSHRPGAQTDLRPSISAFRAVLATLPPMPQCAGSTGMIIPRTTNRSTLRCFLMIAVIPSDRKSVVLGKSVVVLVDLGGPHNTQN